MNSPGWLVVLIPIAVIGIYLFSQRRRAAAPLNSIYRSVTVPDQDEAAGVSHSAQDDSQLPRPRSHGGCCGLTR